MFSTFSLFAFYLWIYHISILYSMASPSPTVDPCGDGIADNGTVTPLHIAAVFIIICSSSIGKIYLSMYYPQHN
jgi:hypothetical protein